jgi:hypothetical protein
MNIDSRACFSVRPFLEFQAKAQGTPLERIFTDVAAAVKDRPFDLPEEEVKSYAALRSLIRLKPGEAEATESGLVQAGVPEKMARDLTSTMIVQALAADPKLSAAMGAFCMYRTGEPSRIADTPEGKTLGLPAPECKPDASQLGPLPDPAELAADKEVQATHALRSILRLDEASVENLLGTFQGAGVPAPIAEVMIDSMAQDGLTREESLRPALSELRRLHGWGGSPEQSGVSGV